MLNSNLVEKDSELRREGREKETTRCKQENEGREEDPSVQ